MKQEPKDMNDFEYVIQSFRIRTEINGTTHLVVKCCGIEVERIAIASEIKASGLPSIVKGMADQAALIGQGFFTASICVVPEALEVVVDHVRNSEAA
ncbi:hypothetical protein [Aestuariivirga sp.]|uniref:hypothetical protein n=1 Tax=Aestuariivirga sp. TaxID=2650926 RepID=UPI003593A854